MDNCVVFDRERLKDFKKATLHFGCNDEYYEIKTSLIADICVNTKIEKRTGDLIAADGFIELLPAAGEVCGKKMDEWGEWKNSGNLLKRLKTGADLSYIKFTYKDESITLYLPCNPLRDCEGNVIEYSNCPSFESIEGESLRIYAGQSSKCGNREEVIYHEVFTNWDNVMGEDYRPDWIEGYVNKISLGQKHLSFEYELYNHRAPCGYIWIAFDNYKVHSFDMYLGNGFQTDIKVEKMLNGHILFKFEECKVCLECEKISVYHSID